MRISQTQGFITDLRSTDNTLAEPLIYAEFNMKCQDESEERELYFKGENSNLNLNGRNCNKLQRMGN